MMVANLDSQIRELAQHRAMEKTRGLFDQAMVSSAVEKELQASPQQSLRSLRCEFHEGVLVLRGQVNSYYLKQLAQEIVRKIDGVGVVVNTIVVVP